MSISTDNINIGLENELLLIKELKVLIEEYLDKYRNQTLNSLGMKCGVSVSTLRRIVLLELKKGPSDHTVFKLLSYLLKERDIDKLKKRFQGKQFILDPLERIGKFGTMISDAKESELEEFLRKRENYFVYKLAANRAGVTKEKVVQLFGMIGVNALNELYEEGYLEFKEEDGKYHASRKSVFVIPQEVLIGHISELLRFTLNEKDIPGKVFANLSESVNKETYIRVCEVAASAYRDIRELIFNEENKGDLPVFFFEVVDTLDL
ncbi:MAG: hypothetical protein HQK49_18790 [Oligoflexia bacterium]|nr:hypothetical protein [Oligoflexia bacterium]